LRVVWINKSPWRKPGPIVYMGLLNACAFAWNGLTTTLFVEAGGDSDTEADMREFYGLEPHALLQIRRIAAGPSSRRAVYRAALQHIDSLCNGGESVLVCTRELGCLPALFALRRRHRSRLRVLHECHDYYWSTRHLAQRGFTVVRRQWSERMLLPQVDGLICLTEYQRALYQSHLPQRPALALPLGTLPHPVAPGQLEQRRHARSLAYIGHLHDYKGLDALFALAYELQRHGVTLHAMGGGAAQIDSLRQRARKTGIEATLLLTPFVPPRELHARLATTVSIGLVPLQDTYYNRYLTCPVKALDFMSHALPVIGTDLPSVRAVLGDAGCYADFDPGPTARLIVDLLADPALYTAQSEKIRARAEMLTWQRRAAAVCELASALFATRA
jgi:glycosyltransferase involved in cell wall biosynthesis